VATTSHRNRNTVNDVVDDGDPPESDGGVIGGAAHARAEAGLDAEVARVGVEVGDELVPGRVRRRARGKRRHRKLAEAERKVEAEPLVRAVPPRRRYARVLLQHQRRHAALLEARRRRQSRRAGADDHRARNPHLPRTICGVCSVAAAVL
jgi:hypothetical protein